jgi:hypothetical protein
MFPPANHQSGCQGVFRRLQESAVSALRPETIVGRCGEEHEERREENAEDYQEREAVPCSVCSLTSPYKDDILIKLILRIVLSKDQSFSSKAFQPLENTSITTPLSPISQT